MSIEIMSIVLNALLGGSLLVTIVTIKSTRRKANAEARAAEEDNDAKAAQTLSEFIVKPLKKELNGLRKDVNRLQKAIDKIGDCPHAGNCPVRGELQHSQECDEAAQPGKDGTEGGTE